MKKMMLFNALFIMTFSNFGHALAETNLSGQFTITSIKYRTTPTGHTVEFDCSDCLLIEGAGSPGCGSGFVIQGAIYGSEDAKLLKSLAMLAYSTGKKVEIGRSDCIPWNGEWKGKVNRIYIY